MSRSLLPLFLSLALLLGGAGCATFVTHGVSDPSSTPHGVRIYAPRHYLLVDSSTKPNPSSVLLSLPDPCRAYDIKPLTVFSKQDFKVELSEDSNLKTLTANQDTTSFLTFVKEAATLAAKAQGLPVSQAVINGTFGLADGVYAFDDAGGVVAIAGKDKWSMSPGRCPGAGS